mgnify:CR=1 FL=1
MPLRIKLPAKEKIIINGAVIENAGEATTVILHNKADILRRKEVMKEEDAVSPSRRIYYSLQCAYLFKDDRKKYLDTFEGYATDYEDAAPSAKPLLDDIRKFVAQEKYYEALRKTLKVIEHETERLIEVGILPRPEEAK